MQYIKIFCIIILLFISATAVGQNYEPTLALISSEKEKLVKIIYDATGTPLQNSPEVFSIVRFQKHANNEFIAIARDIDLKLVGKNKWIGEFYVDDYTVNFFLEFMNGNIIKDNNDGKGYIYFLKDKNKYKEGSFGTVAQFFVDNTSTVFTYNPQRARELLDKEFQNYPSSRSKFLYTFARITDYTNKHEVANLEKTANQLFKEYKLYDENVLFELRNIFNKLGYHEKANNCLDLIIQEFPDSYLTFQFNTIPYQKEIVMANNIKLKREQFIKLNDVMQQNLKTHISDVPIDIEIYNVKNTHRDDADDELLKKLTYAAAINYLQLRRLFEYYLKEGDLQEWVDLIKYEEPSIYTTRLFDYAAKELIERDTDLAKKFSTIAISWSKDQLNSTERTLQEKSWIHSSEREIELLRKRNYTSFLVTYGRILEKQLKINEALEKFNEAIDISGRLNPNLNEHYIDFLLRNNMLDKAKQEYEEIKKIGKLTPVLNQLFDKLYIGESVEVGENNNKIYEYLRDKILSGMKNINAPGFTLFDIVGDTIRLEDFKGKIVIIDFWATWCAPCIASFPVMQKVIEHFRNQDIVFLFINLDQDEVTDKIKRQVIDQGYSFQILLDPKNITAKAYAVHGIPVKYVIDKNGIIRFIKGGVHDLQDELDEISIMLDLITTKGILNEL